MFRNIEIKDLKQRLYDIEKIVSDHSVEIEKLKTHINSLRGLFNRKFAPGAAAETIKNEPSVDGLDSLRKDVKPNP